MIYILSGNDTKSKNVYLKKLSKSNIPVFIPSKEITKEKIFDYALSVSLFGELPVVVFSNFLEEGEFELSVEDLILLKDSSTTFIFLENKLLSTEIKKYSKFGIVEDFSLKVSKQIPKMNVFDIADAFSKRDKINTWMLYRNAVSSGVAPEEISGIIFWKIKMMILNGTRIFTSDELKKMSSLLVSIYHKAHRGECDFVISLEQFVLLSLSK